MKVLYEEKEWRILFPYRFRIYEDGIEAYFFPYTHFIPFYDVKNVEVIERIPWYVGWD